MIKFTIPGFGPLEMSRVVTDYTGTHSFKGVVRRSVRTRLAGLARLVEVHVLTIDTFDRCRRIKLQKAEVGPILKEVRESKGKDTGVIQPGLLRPEEKIRRAGVSRRSMRRPSTPKDWI